MFQCQNPSVEKRDEHFKGWKSRFLTLALAKICLIWWGIKTLSLSRSHLRSSLSMASVVLSEKSVMTLAIFANISGLSISQGSGWPYLCLPVCLPSLWPLFLGVNDLLMWTLLGVSGESGWMCGNLTSWRWLPFCWGWAPLLAFDTFCSYLWWGSFWLL